MNTDTPLQGHPSAQLALFGAATGFAVMTWWVPRVAWGIVHDRCGQSHRKMR
jgi:hypothetical protein